jgi:hypothetical protein
VAAAAAPVLYCYIKYEGYIVYSVIPFDAVKLQFSRAVIIIFVLYTFKLISHLFRSCTPVYTLYAEYNEQSQR